MLPVVKLNSSILTHNGAADQRRAAGELARVAKRPLHSLDGRRVAPDGKRITVRAIDTHKLRLGDTEP